MWGKVEDEIVRTGKDMSVLQGDGEYSVSKVDAHHRPLTKRYGQDR